MPRLAPVIAALAWLCLGQPAAARLVIACGAVGTEAALCREGAEAWARAEGHEVALVAMPAGSTERLALIQQLLAARSADIDVFQLDIVWPGILARHLLDLGPHLPPEEVAAHLPALIANNSVGGRLVALPWFANAGLLYYRADLLARHGRGVPESWEALEATARHIQAAEGGWGLVFQGRAYEGLTVNALEWLHADGAGRIVEPDGRVSIATPEAAAVLRRAAGWVGTIAPRGVLNHAEEDARGIFQSGQAVFMRNWPYAWPLLEAEGSAVAGHVGVVPLPGGGAVLGGEQLAVSRHSRQPEAAISLVRYLTGAAEQRRRALAAGAPPTRPALYEDADLQAANPAFALLAAALEGAVARPSSVTGNRYNQVSAEFWNAVHNTLSGRLEAEVALARLDRILARVGRDGQW
ncbi:ABC transporter substrate-binding protein [Roseococcus thiosulfatophilus]|uniref:ABC transporter substrate-binding protein n=1 Tax=Roseococcus thiosulfatophilus TaxID=35813 RepID=UPI001A8C94DE|nr:ABC transporter substrate-binding protein [Roseococcus thiosulfatophilus]